MAGRSRLSVIHKRLMIMSEWHTLLLMSKKQSNLCIKSIRNRFLGVQLVAMTIPGDKKWTIVQLLHPGDFIFGLIQERLK